MRSYLSPLNLVSLIFLLFIALSVVGGDDEGGETAVAYAAEAETAVPTPAAAIGALGGGQMATPAPRLPVDEIAIVPPYDDYFITQGHHGASYGHLAIDLSGGKGATILSPLSGEVTQLYVDEWGNPTLVIANERYEAMLLHGYYTVQIGDRVRQGEPIGTEGNLGYTTDMNGVRCGNGRDCGYHTHLNIYDKSLQMNVDPFIWIEYRDSLRANTP